MQERTVTIGENTFPLDTPFLVLATQNPIEQEGTYPLPEAQVDRFMLKLSVEYPNRDEELQIMRRMATGPEAEVSPVVKPEEILRARKAVEMIYLDQQVEQYIVDLVLATRDPASYGLDDLSDLISYGASPRASIYPGQDRPGPRLPSAAWVRDPRRRPGHGHGRSPPPGASHL